MFDCVLKKYRGHAADGPGDVLNRVLKAAEGSLHLRILFPTQALFLNQRPSIHAGPDSGRFHTQESDPDSLRRLNIRLRVSLVIESGNTDCDVHFSLRISKSINHPVIRTNDNHSGRNCR